MDVKEVWKDTFQVLEEAPTACPHCGSPLAELGTEYSAVLAHLPQGSSFYGKVPYKCQHVTCGKVIYAPSLKYQKRCCF